MICHNRECSSLSTRDGALRAHLTVLSPIVHPLYGIQIPHLGGKKHHEAVWAAFQDTATQTTGTPSDRILRCPSQFLHPQRHHRWGEDAVGFSGNLPAPSSSYSGGRGTVTPRGQTPSLPRPGRGPAALPSANPLAVKGIVSRSAPQRLESKRPP